MILLINTQVLLILDDLAQMPSSVFCLILLILYLYNSKMRYHFLP